MSLRIIATINSQEHYVAFEEINTGSQPYTAELESFSNISIKTSGRTGGYWEPKFGSIEYLPTVFENDWPPPQKHTLQATLNDVVILEGTGQLKELALTNVPYDIYSPSFSDTISAGDTDTFFNYFSAAAATLGLTLNTDLATDADITFTLSRDKLLIKVLDEMTEGLNHAFHITSNTLFLIDLLKDDGTSTNIDEFDIIASDYSAPIPYSLFKNGDETLDGDFPYGKEFSVSPSYQTTPADMQIQLSRTKEILDKYFITLRVPFDAYSIEYGNKLTWTDTSRIQPINVTMWAREFNYAIDAGEEILVIQGEGEIN